MLLFKKVEDLKNHLSQLSKLGATTGFVPTMGALHQGHISLIESSKKKAEFTVCSIFVNPTQFNDAGDLEKYPRTTTADIELLSLHGCDILFLPPVDEVYPDDPVPLDIDFNGLEKPMEGTHRPGHFEGMAQVVKRFLDIVEPTFLFMGQKDYQQAAIVRKMIEQLNLGCQLVVCPIVREEDGLAMSSRNVRLTEKQRSIAPHIFQMLEYAKSLVGEKTPAAIKELAMMQLNTEGMEPEYFEIVDGFSLQPVQSFDETNLVVACTAVKLKDIRLIDNIVMVNKN